MAYRLIVTLSLLSFLGIEQALAARHTDADTTLYYYATTVRVAGTLLGTAQTRPQAVARTETFAEFFARFRAALASGRAADVAALTHTPFLYQGRQLDTAGFTRIVPTLFSAAVKRCFATAKPIPEDDRQVVFCKPYAFYFGRDDAGKGGILLLEFAADGEDAR